MTQLTTHTGTFNSTLSSSSSFLCGGACQLEIQAPQMMNSVPEKFPLVATMLNSHSHNK